MLLEKLEHEVERNDDEESKTQCITEHVDIIRCTWKVVRSNKQYHTCIIIGSLSISNFRKGMLSRDTVKVGCEQPHEKTSCV